MHARRALAMGQGAYYALTGIWSLVDIHSFQRVTGPKHDVWLVKTVGTLVTAVGAALMIAAWRDEVTPQTAALAGGCAVGLAGIGAWYATRGVISKVYLADAAVEAGLAAAWLRRSRSASPS